MRMAAILAGVLATVALAAPALATESQDTPTARSDLSDPWKVAVERPTNVADLLTRLDRDARYAADRAWEAADGWAGYAPDRDRSSQWAASSRDVWFETERFDDRLRLRTEGPLRRLDGSPLPPGPLDPATLDAEHYDLTYIRGWTETLGQTASGLDVTLTPHLGVGVGSRGGTTEAGATLRIGRGLEKLVPDGGDAFGERPRWYLYAAGSGRAVGYNFARNRDGDFARSGVSQDSGNFLGDASLGVAMRRGPVHSSLSVVYREIETEGLRAGHGVDTDVSEGLIAFQLSIKPE
ncbi:MULTISPECIES: lipid A-modifier LpxR family protein [unclassified Brevundimonas]|uniref:lipid A-modifier LpxR family protein n=1 Tax=unclassified Brevundimonas TaxID=2622653 RepID=UPI000B1F3BAC|nr:MULTISPECIES: lipid A-modifier LpxR family protein [unclassified Brevundimonas]